MASVMEIVVNARDNASGILEGIAAKGDEMGEQMSERMAKVALVSAGAGVALEGFARKQADSNEKTKRLAASLGETDGSVREMAIGLSNVTFPMEDVLDLLETGRQRGLESAEDLEKYATTWDTIGDATGLAGPALGKAGVALESVGISAGQEEKAMAAFGFMTENTTNDVGGFLKILERVGPDLNAMGGDVDDAAAILGILENEFGLTGRAAQREFQQAVQGADGDMGAMLDTLGISSDKLGEYRDQVSASGDVIQRNADIHAESYTPIQRMQHAAEELMFKYGDLASVAGAAAPVLMAVGPIMKGVGLATKGLSSAMSFLAANPIVLVIVAVAALVAGLVIAYKKSETFRAIVDRAFRVVADAGRWLWERMLKPAFDGIRGGFDWVMRAAKTFGRAWSGVMRAGGKAVDLLTSPYRAGLNLLSSGIEKVVNGAAGAINRIPAISIPSWVPGIGGRSFSLPNVPTISIPRLHSGGRFRTASAGGEGLALLKDQETVVEPGGMDTIARELRAIRDLLADGQIIEVDGDRLWRVNRRQTRKHARRGDRLGFA